MVTKPSIFVDRIIKDSVDSDMLLYPSAVVEELVV